MMHVDQMHVIM